jgi:hypothetical protein
MAGVRITMDKTGLADLHFILNGLNKKDAKNAARRTFAALARDVRQELKGVEPKRTGGLKRGTRSRVTRGGGAIVYGQHPEAAHAAIVRKGTKARKTRKGYARGSMPDNKAMQNVLSRAATEYPRRAAQQLAKEVADSIYGRVKSRRRGK